MQIELPKGSSAYVFGSALSSSQPRDLDILVVYDSKICSPSKAYAYHEPFLNQLTEMCKVPLDVTLLSNSEEHEVGFIKSEHCVSLKTYCEHIGNKADYTTKDAKEHKEWNSMSC